MTVKWSCEESYDYWQEIEVQPTDADCFVQMAQKGTELPFDRPHGKQRCVCEGGQRPAEVGRGAGTRTLGLQTPSLALYQLSYTPNQAHCTFFLMVAEHVMKEFQRGAGSGHRPKL